MKQKISILLAAAGLLGFSLVNATASAQEETTDVYVVHGLNLDGQEDQDDGGTNVTVCADGEVLVPDLEFGQIEGPLALASDTAVELVLYEGADVDCDDPGDADELVEEEVTPSGPAVALVATSAHDELALTAFPLEQACSETAEGRITAVHASGDTDEVSVLVDEEEVGTLSFGNTLDGDLPADEYAVEVDLADATLVGPVDIAVAAQTNTFVYVVGNIGEDPTPAVALVGETDLEDCSTTTTSSAPTTAVPDGAAGTVAGATAEPQTGDASIGISG